MVKPVGTFFLLSAEHTLKKGMYETEINKLERNRA
jgi:hypothetical protein